MKSKSQFFSVGSRSPSESAIALASPPPLWRLLQQQQLWRLLQQQQGSTVPADVTGDCLVGLAFGCAQERVQRERRVQGYYQFVEQTFERARP